MSRDLKLSMNFDGDPADNPFVPPVGAEVAVCAHEPRPLYLHNHIDPIPSTLVYWANLCRSCHVAVSDAPESLRLRVVLWSEADAARLRQWSRL